MKNEIKNPRAGVIVAVIKLMVAGLVPARCSCVIRSFSYKRRAHVSGKNSTSSILSITAVKNGLKHFRYVLKTPF